MRTLIVIALLAMSLNGWSQQRRERPNREEMEKMTPEQRQELRLNKMTQDLNLDTKQQEEVKKLMAEEGEKAEKFRAKRKEAKEKQLLESAKERKEMAEKMRVEKEAHDAKMKKILSPEQYTKWENNRLIQQEKMRQKRGQRKVERQLQKVDEK